MQISITAGNLRKKRGRRKHSEKKNLESGNDRKSGIDADPGSDRSSDQT